MATDRIRFAEIELKVEKAKAVKPDSAVVADMQWLLDELRIRLVAEDKVIYERSADDDH